jgi:hypothetical protein
MASPATTPPTLVRIRFDVPCLGRPEAVRVEAEPALTPRVARCLARVVTSWQFPAFRPGERVRVVYPLRYVP